MPKHQDDSTAPAAMVDSNECSSRNSLVFEHLNGPITYTKYSLLDLYFISFLPSRQKHINAYRMTMVFGSVRSLCNDTITRP